MSATTLPRFNRPPSSGANVTPTLAILLAAWLVLVFLLGAYDLLVTPRGTPPLPILLAVVLPIGLFVLAYRISDAFRQFVLTFDLRVALGIQAWRFAGLGFLALYTYHVLPGVFAWPAGLGDIAIGISAPWVLLAISRNRRFVASRAFALWNAFGLLDLVVAVGIGALVSTLVASGEITTGVMARLPLALIPAFLVPIFVMLHITALAQARHLATEELSTDRCAASV